MILSRVNRLHEQLILRKKRHGYRRKIAFLLSQLKIPPIQANTETMRVRQFFPHYHNSDWHSAYATLNGIISDYYLPEDLYYTAVERSLNNPAYAAIYSDKASLGFLLQPGDYVGTAFFRLRDHYYDATGSGVDLAFVESWLSTQTEVVVKPARASGGGRGVVIGPPDLALRELCNGRHSVVVQPVFRQHQDLGRFNDESLNSIRLMSLRHEGQIHIVSAILRLGVTGSRIDNVTRGAVGVGIDQGVLRAYGADYNFNKHEIHPTSHLRFEGTPVPHWDRILDLAVRSHQRFLEADLISWDLTVGTDGNARVIEANIIEQEINGHQILNGPVFAPFLDTLLVRVKNEA